MEDGHRRYVEGRTLRHLSETGKRDTHEPSLDESKTPSLQRCTSSLAETNEGFVSTSGVDGLGERRTTLTR